jgi:MFS family permease
MLTKRVVLTRLTLLSFSLLCAAAMWSYWYHLTRDVIGGTLQTSSLKPKALSDLYPRWYGARELLLHHRDPYGIEVSHELQIAFYGRLLDASRPGEPRDQERFAYPLYVVFLLAPFVHMDFHTVRIIFWYLLAAVTIGTAALWQRFFGLSLSWAAFGTLAVMLVGSIGVIQGLSILQLGLLVSCFIAAAAVCAISGQLFLAGAFLALSTIKPQLAILPVVWFVLWAIADWRRRRSLLAGFAATLGALIIASEYLVPGWLWRYPDALRSYADYFGAKSLLGVLFRSPLHWLVAILALLLAAKFCWYSRRQPAQSVSFAISLGFALTLTVSIVPTVTSPFNQVLLLPVVLLLIRHRNDLWRANALTRFAVVMFWGCALLPWLPALGIILTPYPTRQSWPLYLWYAPLSASLALPFAALSVLIQMRRLADSPLSLNPTRSSH